VTNTNIQLVVIAGVAGMVLIGPVAVAQERSSWFVTPPDRTTALILASDAAQVCNGVSYIDAVTGKANIGTATGITCLGRQSTTAATCTADGNTNCVIPVNENLPANKKLIAVEGPSATSILKAENIKKGIKIGGVVGDWPGTCTSCKMNLAVGVVGKDVSALLNYPTILSTDSKKSYILFGDDGTSYTFTISSPGGTITPSTGDADYFTNIDNTLFKEFTVSGAEDLTPGSIVHGKTIFGQAGTAIPRGPWIKSATLTSVFNRLATGTSQTPVAKANIFKEAGTETYWMLLRVSSNTPAPVSNAASKAFTDCNTAKVSITVDGTSMILGGLTAQWDVPTEADIERAFYTGATAASGLFEDESTANLSMYGTNQLFWTASTPGSTPNKKFYFKDQGTVPTVSAESSGGNAMTLCVYRSASIGQGNDRTSFMLKTGTDPVLFETKLPDGTDGQLRAHVYLTSSETRAFAYVFNSLANTPIQAKYLLNNDTTTQVTSVCTDLKKTLATLNRGLPSAFGTYTWMPVSKAILDANAAGFTLEPFLGSVTDGRYSLGNLLLVFDSTQSQGSFGLFNFTAAGQNPVTAIGTEGSVICTAGP